MNRLCVRLGTNNWVFKKSTETGLHKHDGKYEITDCLYASVQSSLEQKAINSMLWAKGELWPEK